MESYATIFWFVFFVLLLFLLISLPLVEILLKSSHPRRLLLQSTPPITIDAWTTPQNIEAPANQSARSQAQGEGILGGLRSTILLAPVNASSSLSISSGSVTYQYTGTGANGFQIGWFPEIPGQTHPPLNLSNYQRFSVDVSNVSTPVVLQMDVLDTQQKFASVSNVLSTPGNYEWPFRAFLGIDFSSVQSLQLEGDIRIGPGQMVFGPLLILS